MPNVSFDEEPQYRIQSYGPAKTGITQLIISWGFAKNQKQAELVLLGLTVLAVVIGVGVAVTRGSTSKLPPLPPTPGLVVPTTSSRSSI